MYPTQSWIVHIYLSSLKKPYYIYNTFNYKSFFCIHNPSLYNLGLSKSRHINNWMLPLRHTYNIQYSSMLLLLYKICSHGTLCIKTKYIKWISHTNSVTLTVQVSTVSLNSINMNLNVWDYYRDYRNIINNVNIILLSKPINCKFPWVIKLWYS